MYIYSFPLALMTLFNFFPLLALKELPKEMRSIMHQEKYKHSIWGIYAKDLVTGEILYDLNSNKLFSPASTSKLFSVAALLDAFGDDYRFETPVFASAPIKNGKLVGDLILVAQGDLTFGGRQPDRDTLSFTKMDHIIANDVPGAIITKEDPLAAINDLAKQIRDKGLSEIEGNILIDVRLFETTEKRGMTLSPIMINENLIDFVINPTEIGEQAHLFFRPVVKGYSVDNQIKTVAKDEPLEIVITSNEDGQKLLLKGSVPLDHRDVVKTFAIKDPKAFARSAFIQALESVGIKVKQTDSREIKLPEDYKNYQQMALWISPPLSEYGKLILKVSHNLGADLVPLLLASRNRETTFSQGMELIGDFLTREVKLSPNEFVFIDAAGGNENRLTPRAEAKLLDYMYHQTATKFERFKEALPILGVDGSLEDFGKDLEAKGKVFAKPGTGVSFNLATQKFFLITKAFSGYIQGKNNHLYAYMVVVNNAAMPTLEDIYEMFEDASKLSNLIYQHTDDKN
ncbi:D-alanyl-D-alanine carboxypeptidase/D-alanyl-D-alanine-endopeptidase [Criblamydia sequanensis]|uniref:D-alanyl-D-alanine carboxypeptidase n=1 Tax=Candidatus Criblamydia sequanensis CRIB-18 TaxID=1437425 RepID=A0A090D3E8_9BACT|nr:D-alanyl-D-alanine carboxypeptidase/D-alanyl-D-alanine-endopeptidase [Criblamydia sequanensis]CDR35258.1 D-alanyl-D-alanine carboxypeptidase [Criblamydia sequanensis CRIB-18]